MGTMCAGLCAFGYVFQVGPQSVPVGSDVRYSSTGQVLNVTHTPGTEEIVVNLPGIYTIRFAVYTTGNNPQDWGIAVNGVVQANFNGIGQNMLGDLKIALEAGDIITIRNVGTVPDPAELRDTNSTTSWVDIEKIDS